jgi:hypothetical protein
MHEYIVGRTVKKGEHDEFRLTLINSPLFMDAISDDSGKGIVECEKKLRPIYGAYNKRHHTHINIISALSKIVAFYKT